MENQNIKNLKQEKRDLLTDLVETLEKIDDKQAEDKYINSKENIVISADGEIVMLNTESKNKRDI